MRALWTACLFLAGCGIAGAEPLTGPLAAVPPAGTAPAFQKYQFKSYDTGDSTEINICQLEFTGIAARSKAKIAGTEKGATVAVYCHLSGN